MDEDYITLTDLFDRGWTMAIINKMRLEPEKTVKSGKTVTKLYSLAKVLAMEQRNFCRNLLIKTNGNYVEREMREENPKIRELMDWVRHVKIDITYLSDEEVTRRAVEAYNEWHNTNIQIDSSDIFVERITKNYIRHSLTNYDKILKEMDGKFNRADAYPVLKARITERIDDEWKTREEKAKQEAYEMAED